MSSPTMQLKRKIGAEVVFFSYVIQFQLRGQTSKKHFQQAIPAPRVTMETPHLKIDLGMKAMRGIRLLDSVQEDIWCWMYLKAG